jgi:hypothetical protein
MIMKILLILFQGIWLIFFAAQAAGIKKHFPAFYVTRECNRNEIRTPIVVEKSALDTIRLEDKQLLVEAFEKYFAAGENTIRKQVNLNPCQITVIETYSYYGNPHIRLWTFNTKLVTIDRAFGDKLRINLGDNGNTMYDSRIKANRKLYEINLKGIPGDAMTFRNELERIWYQYQQTCNEPPEAY